MDTKLIKNIDIKYSEMNYDLSLKPYSLLNFLQDIASESAENLGFGYSYIKKENLAWFLIKYRMEFDEYPIGVYNLKISTQPRGYNKLFAYREFEIFNDEKVFGRIFSMWSIIDLKNHCVVSIENAINNPYMARFQHNSDDLAFAKIKPLSKIDYQKEFQVRYNDLDVNKHANNGNYIIWAFETLDCEFLINHKIKTLDLIYKKETKYNEKIICEVEINDDTTLHRIKNSNEEDLCLIECKWEKKTV